MVYAPVGRPGYVPFNSLLFDRPIAAFRYTGNAGFLISVAESAGYLGSSLDLVMKNFVQVNQHRSWTQFFIQLIFSVFVFLSYCAGNAIFPAQTNKICRKK